MMKAQEVILKAAAGTEVVGNGGDHGHYRPHHAALARAVE